MSNNHRLIRTVGIVENKRNQELESVRLRGKPRCACTVYRVSAQTTICNIAVAFTNLRVMQTKRGIEMLQNDKCRQSEFGALNLNN